MIIPDGFYKGWNKKTLNNNKGPSYHGLVVDQYGWNFFTPGPQHQQPPYSIEMSLPMEYLR